VVDVYDPDNGLALDAVDHTIGAATRGAVALQFKFQWFADPDVGSPREVR